MRYLENGCVVLTGASGGMGREMAGILIEKYGCEVIGIGRSAEKLKSLKEKYGDSFSYYIFDVSERENWTDFAGRLKESGKNANILINNAGVLPNFERFETSGAQMTERVMKINFLSCVYSVEELLPVLKNSGKPPVIVNVSSSAALFSLAGTSGYSASKSALKSFTEAVSDEQRGNVLVSLVMPGFCKTEIFRNQKHSGGMETVNAIASDPAHIVRRTLRLVNRGKRRIIAGWDATVMNIFTKLMPRASLRVYSFVMKKSGVGLFKDIF